MPAVSDPDSLIAFQGSPGAYSNLACVHAHPELTPLPCATFEETFAAVQSGQARLAMIPVDNSVAGRVADIHHLLPGSRLHIVGEHFQRVNHQLMALPGTRIGDLRVVSSHIHALSQCRKVIAELGLRTEVHADTAGSAKELIETGDRERAVIASSLAAKIYGLEILHSDIEDAEHNTTRFLIMAREPVSTPFDETESFVTSFLFRVRNIPAALYKTLGGFATNGVNMTKLESYVGDRFRVAQFYADIEGHPESRSVQLALEELRFFATEVRIFGVYRASPFRHQQVADSDN